MRKGWVCLAAFLAVMLVCSLAVTLAAEHTRGTGVAALETEALEPGETEEAEETAGLAAAVASQSCTF
jgi:hypothetical protein